MGLKTHRITLRGERVVLRPMTEADWNDLVRWDSDPDVVYWTDGHRNPYNPDDIKGIYEEVSQSAFCFIIELDGEPIGDCWLQQMNIEGILRRHPGEDCRRIDLMIGEKDLWGQGLGTDAIRTLTRFGFEQEGADLIFGLVGHHNPRCLRAFQKAGYEIEAEHGDGHEVVVGRARYLGEA